MKKVFRIAAAIIVLALALYLMVTLFFVFIVLAGIGLVYLLFMRFLVKPQAIAKTQVELS